MCDTCGCGGEHNGFTIHAPATEENHSHGHHHDHTHEHDHAHEHSHSETGRKEIFVETDVLAKNNLLAERNRGWFEAKQITAVNLVSSPGSGKTTLLEKLISALKNTRQIFVIEGDQQTTADADRIANAGAKALQVNTGNGCHLDAHMINHAVKDLQITDGALLFIENVGNLVCPALFDLGEQKRIVIASTTEGEDKPLKYPTMFQSADICLLNKTDLLPYLDFSVDLFKENLNKVNPGIPLLLVSAKTTEGFEQIIKLF